MKLPPRARAALRAGEAVQAALAVHGIADAIRGERVVTEWDDLVGERIARRTRADRVVDGVLWIEVATSAWLHELNLLKPQLTASLLERLGEPHPFRELRFQLAGRHRRAPTTIPRPRPGPAPERLPSRAATGAAREAIVREVAAVDDDELRELIARVRITHDR